MRPLLYISLICLWLAGCATAWGLAQVGWHSTVLDAQPRPAAGASGNPAGLFHGIVNPQDGAHARFNRAAALLAQRAAFDAAGGFCTDYIVGDFEDSDLCLKLRAAGGEIAYEPGAELYHFERQSIALHDGHARTLAGVLNRRLHHPCPCPSRPHLRRRLLPPRPPRPRLASCATPRDCA